MAKGHAVAVVLCLVGALIVLASAAATAQGLEGPNWIHGGNKTFLPASNEINVKSEAQTTFEFRTSGTSVACQKYQLAKGKLIGGHPGTGSGEVTFTECTVVARSEAECEVHSEGAMKGIIGPYAVKTALAWEETGSEALVAYFPASATSNVFVTLILKGPKCPVFGEKFPLEATGGNVENIKGETFKKKCGVLGEVGKMNGTNFEKTASGAEAVRGALKFPNPEHAFAKSLIWSKNVFEKVECSSAIFALGVTEQGTAWFEIPSMESFGWAS